MTIIMANILTLRYKVAINQIFSMIKNCGGVETDVLFVTSAPGSGPRNRETMITVTIEAIRRKRVALRGFSPDFP